MARITIDLLSGRAVYSVEYGDQMALESIRKKFWFNNLAEACVWLLAFKVRDTKYQAGFTSEILAVDLQETAQKTYPNAKISRARVKQLIIDARKYHQHCKLMQESLAEQATAQSKYKNRNGALVGTKTEELIKKARSMKPCITT